MSRLTQTRSYQALKKHFSQELPHLRQLFEADPQRFERFSMQFEQLFLDYSKNFITKESFELLLDLAKEMQLETAIEDFFTGKKINQTEQRAVLHTALRSPKEAEVFVDGQNIIPEVHAVLEQVKHISDALLSKNWKGYQDEPITDIVNIGIGGSDLGLRMVVKALKPYHQRLKVHFVSNIDAMDLLDTLEKCNPATTVFIVASKSFTTQETLTNAHTARRWFLQAAQDENLIKKHFIAVSTNLAAVEAFGIAPQNCLRFWDWVGGRYSLWSAVGLAIACAVGYPNFEKLLAGAHAMDTHFRSASFEKNMPVILAMLSVCYNNFLGASSHGIFPYHQHLELFTQHFQQVAMESNGKGRDKSGQMVDYQTDTVLWGSVGTNGQHAFFQLLHQGTKQVACDFIGVAQTHHTEVAHHQILLANFFAQTQALMNGKSIEIVQRELKAKGKSPAEIAQLAPFKVFKGNRPSNSILIQKLTPYNLGSLIALYEHKTFVQGVVWDIFSFDQWGVELGKQLAKKILPQLQDQEKVSNHDSSTNGLINVFKKMRD